MASRQQRRVAGGRSDDEPHSYGPAWRELGALERFQILLNHYGTAERLSAASGIPVGSIRTVYMQSVAGMERRQKDGSKKLVWLQSKVIYTDRWVEGFQRARHSMTNSLRRKVEKSKAGKYEAPIVRTRTSVIEPNKRKYTVEYRGFHGRLVRVESKSSWYGYRVEHLPEDDVFAVIENLFDTFMATGQFNKMRIEYLAVADIYSGGRFKDSKLKEDSEYNDVIKLSSEARSFAEHYSPIDFADHWFDWWKETELRGGVRMTELFFALDDSMDRGEPLKMAKSQYKRWKTRRAKNGGDKKGKGRGV